MATEKEKNSIETNEEKEFKSLVVEARTDQNKAFSLWRSYVSTAKTPEERIKRIHQFRCGGY